MDDNNQIEIIDDTNNTSEGKTEVFEMPIIKSTVEEKPIVLDTKVDKKKIKEEKKRQKKEQKKLKKEQRKKKNKKSGKEEVVTSNVYENSQIEVVETAITKGASGAQIIGNINGEEVTPTNALLPSPIDITVKPKVDTKNNVKKVKVVTKKERILSVIVSIFVVLVIGAAGYAAYYFGYETNPSIYTVKNISLELGDELPSTVSYYVTSPHQVDDMEYNLDLSKVSKDLVGTYTYSVVHKNAIKYGNIKVSDTTAPKLTIKDSEDLIFLLDSNIKKEDIVVSCEDISGCTYNLEHVIDSSTPGEKIIKIIAKDNQGNEINMNVTINVVDVKKRLLCISPEVVGEANIYNIRDEYLLSFDSNDYLVMKSANTRYIYSDYSAYFSLLYEKQEDENYIFDRMTFSYITKKNEINTNNLTALTDLTRYYTENGYICSEQ